MDITSVFLALQSLIQGDFDEYAPKVRKYERKLQKEVKENPGNIRAVCLLAMVKCELRKSFSTSLKYLEAAYNTFKDSLSDYDFCFLVTNMSYFYIEECDKVGLARELLQRAIEQKSPFYQSYYAMALTYYKEDQFELALPLFKKAADMALLFRHYYNYAICLSKCNQGGKSIEILKILSSGYDTNVYKAKAYYNLGVIYSLLGETEKAKEVAFNLLTIDYDSFDIVNDMLADLMYSVDEFFQCITLYDKEILLLETSDWLGKYFYSLKEMNRSDDALKKLHTIVDKINTSINSSTLDDFNGNKVDFYDYIRCEKERLESIKTVYRNVFNNNIKPKVKFTVDLLCDCYYIDCPRHSLYNIENKTLSLDADKV